MKNILICLLFPYFSFAATWVIEIKDLVTSEVKTYKYSSVGKSKLETPKVKNIACVVDVGEKLPSTDGKDFYQRLDLMCYVGGGAFSINKVCMYSPSSADLELLKMPQVLQIIDDTPKTKKSKKPDFKSYEVKIVCE